MSLDEGTVYNVEFDATELIFGETKGNIFNELEKLQEKPKKWYRLAQFDAKSSANATMTAITQGKRPIPTGSFQFTARSSKNSSELWVKRL